MRNFLHTSLQNRYINKLRIIKNIRKVTNTINKQVLVNLVMSKKITHIHIFLLTITSYGYSFKYNKEKQTNEQKEQDKKHI